MKTQKELKEILRESLAETWREDMQNYIMKETAYIVELSNGDIVKLEKPRIETSFCFGAGYCGYCTAEEWDDANDMARHARTSEEYFKSENMRQITEKIEALKAPTAHTWKLIAEYTANQENPLKAYVLERYGCNCYQHGREATRDDIQRIISGLEEVKKQFEKRLNTYLKRYGLSKVRTWSYLRD